MPIVLRLQSFLESRLQGFGPQEMVSIFAELLVAACFFGPFVCAFMLAGWVLKKSAPAALRRRVSR